VPELSHDTTEDGFHEIQLSGKQLVFLFILVTFASVVIFLCGVHVGRGARAARGEEPSGVAAEATTTPPTPQAVPGGGPPAAEPPVPAPEADELSYHKRLQGADAPKDQLKSAAPASGDAKAAPPVKTPPAHETAAAETPAPAAGRPGAWVVQVVALQDRAVATSLVKRLNGKGYPAFLVTTAAGSVPRMYKVQVGRYNDKREAEQIRQRLEKEEQFKPWISR
jgi:cell division septation protein DedD